MMHRYYFLILISLPFFTKAQSSSFNNWLNFNVKYSIIKPLEIKLKIGYRSIDFYSESSYLDCTLKYKFHKHFKLALGWRYAGKGNPTDVDAITNRFHIDGSTKINLLKRLFLKSRLRYQLRFKDWFVSPLGHIPKHSIRVRLLLNYTINKQWMIIIGGELFTAFHYHSTPSFDPFRIINGIRYTIKNTHTISLYYNIEHDTSSAYTAHILALSYGVNLTQILKRKRKSTTTLH